MNIQKIGKLIAACRKEKGMTQAQLAEKLGVTNKTVSRWENGNYMPDLTILEPLSHELGISLEELLTGVSVGQINRDQTHALLSDTIQYSGIQLTKQKKRTWTAIVLALSFLIGSLLLLYINKDHAYRDIQFSEFNNAVYYATKVVPLLDADEQWDVGTVPLNNLSYSYGVEDQGDNVLLQNTIRMVSAIHSNHPNRRQIMEELQNITVSWDTHKREAYVITGDPNRIISLCTDGM